MTLFQRWQKTDYLVLVGIATWALIAYLSVFVDERTVSQMRLSEGLLYLFGLFGFLLGFLFCTLPWTDTRKSRLPVGLVIQWVSVVLMQAIELRDFHYIYFIIWSAQLPHLVRAPVAMALTFTSLLLLHLMGAFNLQSAFSLWSVLLYFVFSCFGILLSMQTIDAERARDHLAFINAELAATQTLLSATVREHERIRIARDLHDSMGHHLTSLALQLQLAQHQNGEALDKTIADSRHLTKLLLADVRATVSEMRLAPNVNLKQLLAPIVSAVPKVHIELTIDDQLVCQNASTAECMWRITQESVTNCLKHSNATHLSLTIFRQNDDIVLEAVDNGHYTIAADQRAITEGNGLKGMRERLRSLGGKLHYGAAAPSGFFVHVQVPDQ